MPLGLQCNLVWTKLRGRAATAPPALQRQPKLRRQCQQCTAWDPVLPLLQWRWSGGQELSLPACICIARAGVPSLLQLFNAADPALADLDETPDHMGADLMASRHDAWEELVMSKVSHGWCACRSARGHPRQVYPAVAILQMLCWQACDGGFGTRMTRVRRTSVLFPLRSLGGGELLTWCMPRAHHTTQHRAAPSPHHVAGVQSFFGFLSLNPFSKPPCCSLGWVSPFPQPAVFVVC